VQNVARRPCTYFHPALCQVLLERAEQNILCKKLEITAREQVNHGADEVRSSRAYTWRPKTSRSFHHNTICSAHVGPWWNNDLRTRGGTHKTETHPINVPSAHLEHFTEGMCNPKLEGDADAHIFDKRR
jgi:hypothetical protein